MAWNESLFMAHCKCSWDWYLEISWWRHQMETFSALLAIRAFMFSLICARTNGWVNTGEAGDLRRHRAHYGVIIMWFGKLKAACVTPFQKPLFFLLVINACFRRNVYNDPGSDLKLISESIILDTETNLPPRENTITIDNELSIAMRRPVIEVTEAPPFANFSVNDKFYFTKGYVT